MTNIAVFASGNGSNFAAIAEGCRTGTIAARTALLVCNKPDARVIGRAGECGVPCRVFDPKEYPHKAAYETQIAAALHERAIDLICLAGYMRIVGNTLLERYVGRILNIHPSLLPAFKGAHAIDDALKYGVKVFGASVHEVSPEVDGGRIVAQSAFEYYGTSRSALEALMHAAEHALYPKAINMFLGRLS